MKRKSIRPLQPPSLSVDGPLSFFDRFIVSFIPNRLPLPHLGSDGVPVRHSAFRRRRTGAGEQNQAACAKKNQLEKKLHELPVVGGGCEMEGEKGTTTIKKKSPSHFDVHLHALLSLSHNPTIHFFFPSLPPHTPHLSPFLFFFFRQLVSSHVSSSLGCRIFTSLESDVVVVGVVGVKKKRSSPLIISPRSC